MSTAVKVNSSPRKLTTDFLANAREAYGDALPDWVEELAKLATQTSGAAAAKRIGMSGSVVTSVCRARYTGDLGVVEARVRGALMHESVDCPVLGEIARDHCLDEQKKKHVGSSAIRTRLYQACRSGGCAHSRLKVEGGHDA